MMEGNRPYQFRGDATVQRWQAPAPQLMPDRGWIRRSRGPRPAARKGVVAAEVHPPRRFLAYCASGSNYRILPDSEAFSIALESIIMALSRFRMRSMFKLVRSA